VQTALSWVVVAILGVAILALARVLMTFLRRKPAGRRALLGKPSPLSSQERQQLLIEIQRVLGEGAPLAESRVKS